MGMSGVPPLRWAGGTLIGRRRVVADGLAEPSTMGRLLGTLGTSGARSGRARDDAGPLGGGRAAAGNRGRRAGRAGGGLAGVVRLGGRQRRPVVLVPLTSWRLHRAQGAPAVSTSSTWAEARSLRLSAWPRRPPRSPDASPTPLLARRRSGWTMAACSC